MSFQLSPFVAKLTGIGMLAILLGSELAVSRTLAGFTSLDERTDKRLARGKRLYAGACTACHSIDGRPTVPDAPDLRDARWQQQRTDEELAKSIANGKGSMPAFKGSPADIEALVAYVR